jgi:peptidoglycan/xylan/chitin deacetylase (PgdA/CDA1 family)
MLVRAASRGAGFLSRPLVTAIGHRYGTIRRVDTEEAAIAITFDDGPHPEFTPMVLELLNSYGARGTFFCLGRYAEKNPSIIQAVAESGHCIANHTYDHKSMPVTTSRERRNQLRMCSQALRPYEQPLFRPPYGHQSIASYLDAWRMGYQIVTWDVTACDWLDKSAEWMAERMMARARKGSILLLHDRLSCAPSQTYFDRMPMIGALRIVLDRWSKDYRFVTLPELLQLGKAVRDNWYWKADRTWLSTLEADNRDALVAQL